MFLPKPSEGGDFTPPPAGVFTAICYRFIDLGTQATQFQGQNRHQRKVMLSWEITDPEQRMEDGKPFAISQRFTWSMHEKSTLRKTLESWRGKQFEEKDFGEGGFDTRNLIGAPCMLSIVHADKEGKTYANISGVMKLPKQMQAGELVNNTVYFSLDDYDAAVFGSLSEGLQNIIKDSPEYQALGKSRNGGGYVAPNFDNGGGDPGWQPDESIPF